MINTEGSSFLASNLDVEKAIKKLFRTHPLMCIYAILYYYIYIENAEKDYMHPLIVLIQCRYKIRAAIPQ